MSSESILEKQAELAVLRPIVHEYTRYGRTEQIQIEMPSAFSDDPLDTKAMLWVQETQKIQHALEKLELKGLIRITSMFGTLEGTRIAILKPDETTSLYKDLDESIPSQGDLPRIVYSIKTGKGKINGLPFKLNKKSDNRRLLRKLLMSPNYRLSRSEAWAAIGHRKTVIDDDDVNEFSRMVSKLRAGLKGISKEHLRYQKNVLQLFADVKITDKNH